jgi:hypothetical protein
MHTFKLTAEQRLKIIQHGYSLKEIEAAVKADIPGAQTLKICFLEAEALEWMQKRHPPKLSIEELYNWWVFYAKREYSNPAKSGLYKAYEERRETGKPLVMYKEMAADNKPHKVY